MKQWAHTPCDKNHYAGLEYSGALCHVTCRGDRRKDIYLDDTDSNEWLAVLGKVCGSFNLVAHTLLPDDKSLPFSGRNE